MGFAFFLIRRPVRAIFLDRTGTQDRVEASGWLENMGERWEKPSTNPRTPEKTYILSYSIWNFWDENMKKSGTSQGQSASELISKRIDELGDWRGKILSRMRKLI
jgi:hypothetical protein